MNSYFESKGFGEECLALSIKEPWVTCGTKFGKTVENRTWQLPFDIRNRRVFLHASAKPDKAAFAVAGELAGVDFLRESHLMVPLGHIVATCVFRRQITKVGTLPPGTDKWFFGPYGWVWEDVTPLKRPLPCKGQLQFWRVPRHLLEQIEREDLL